MAYRFNIKMKSSTFRPVYFDELFDGIHGAFNRIVGGPLNKSESEVIAFSGLRGGVFKRGESHDQSHLIFADSADWSVSTVDPDLANRFAIGLMNQKGEFAFNLQVINITRIVEDYQDVDNFINAPQGIALLKNYDEEVGQDRFHDGSTDIDDFCDALQEHSRNALRNQLGYDEFLKPESVVIRPVDGEFYDSKLIRVRGNVTIATRGHFKISGDPDTVSYLCHMGLGDRKNLGMGYVYRKPEGYQPRQRRVAAADNY
jgi:CRISPR/Cas system endoribonuclease Cas6 (RAMP superfamily)